MKKKKEGLSNYVTTDINISKWWLQSGMLQLVRNSYLQAVVLNACYDLRAHWCGLRNRTVWRENRSCEHKPSYPLAALLSFQSYGQGSREAVHRAEAIIHLFGDADRSY